MKLYQFLRKILFYKCKILKDCMKSNISLFLVSECRKKCEIFEVEVLQILLKSQITGHNISWPTDICLFRLSLA